MSCRIVPLPASGFVSAPWRNGRGVTLTIAGERRPGAAGEGWDGALWRLGTTDIVEDGPFSDLAGFDRLQAVIAGRGLRLDTPQGEVDLSEPFTVRGYRGEAPIACRLGAGPVKVVNLIWRRDLARGAMRFFDAGAQASPGDGLHVLAALSGDATVTIGGRMTRVSAGDALRIDGDPGAVTALAGRPLLASVRRG